MTPLARFVQRIARAGDAGGANVTVAATARLLSRMVAGLAVVQFELMGTMFKGDAAALAFEHHHGGLLCGYRPQGADKQKGRQENRAA